MADGMLAAGPGHADGASEELSATGSYPQILLIRHGETQWNRHRRLQGRMDAPLTLNGTRQCLAVATAAEAHLRSLSPNPRFWVSPLGRARQTASILADCWGIEFERFVEAPEIAERAYGAWEGSTLNEVKAEKPGEFDAYAADTWGYRVPGGESKDELFARIKAWLDRLDQRQAHVVVTHSGCFRALRALYTNAPRAVIDAYREPQTTAFLLQPAGEKEIVPAAALLRTCGVEGAGYSVEI